MLSVYDQNLKLEVDQRFRPKGLRLRENKAVGIILVEVKMKRFGNLSFRYLKEPFIKILLTSAPYGKFYLVFLFRLQYYPSLTSFQTCRLSYKKRSRSCTEPSPQYGGSGCDGTNEQVERCVGKDCK